MATIRQQIIELLESDDHDANDAREISQQLGISEKEVYTHIPHIEKSLANTGKSVAVTPAACLSCGYQFKKRSRPEPPGKCPLCKNERIKKPRFSIQ